MVFFVGAGPGAPDLITVRGAKLLREADVIIYAGSLVNPELLRDRKKDCAVYNSAEMTLEQVISVMEEAESAGKLTVRLHTGDPSIYGAVREQMDVLEQKGIPYASVPGVSSFCAAAAALNLEYTLPGISQTVIISRAEGRTKVPEKENLISLASHGASMVLFLSASLAGKLEEQLLSGGYGKDTPAAVVYRASWPDEKKFLCTVGTLKETLERNRITKTALILVGDAVGHETYERSKLYDPGFTTGYRTAAEEKDSDLIRETGAGNKSAGGRETGAGEAGNGKGGGSVTVIGIGPGRSGMMTAEAEQVLSECDVIIGYRTYTDLVRDRFPEKPVLTTPMRQEEARCRIAMEEAARGKRAAFVCSGDPGVYGLAGLMLELSAEYPGTEVRVLPGITAALSGAALLGAPLTNDFSVVSLSNLLTPEALIRKRLRSAAEADSVLVLYNPSSAKRARFFQEACSLLLTVLPPDRICGIARNIGRQGEKAEICTLSELPDREIDMFCTVFVGNSATRNLNGKMITPRGYAYERNPDICGDHGRT